MRAAFATLGCKLNQLETDSVATQFQDAGHTIVDFAEPADVYVINTCTVTNRADRKSRNLTYRALRAAGLHGAASAPGPPLVVVTGCHVESHREELERDERLFVVPNERKQSIFALVDAHAKGEIVHPRGSVFDFRSPKPIFHTRGMVKVQDGCDNHCTFCIIPAVRGRAQSRPVDEVTAAVSELVAAGTREVVLTGVNMSRYRDGETDFATMVGRCLEVPGDFRMRISSLEPDGLGPAFADLFRHPKLTPHLHLCLQSGAERVLLAMRRQYSWARYRDLAGELRRADPLFNLTTDVIVGFPGETDEDLAATLSAIGEVGFGHVHTFVYSRRTGTRAERMPHQIPDRVKSARSAAVRAASEAQKRRYRSSLVGLSQRLLVERVESESGRTVLRGFGEHYVPIEVRIDEPVAPGRAERFANTFVPVLVTGIADGDDPSLIATLRAAGGTSGGENAAGATVSGRRPG